MPIERTKESLRREMIALLKDQEEAFRCANSLKIKEKLFEASFFVQARKIMFYVSTPIEVNTLDMIDEALALGKQVAVPYVDTEGKRLIPLQIQNRQKDLQKGSCGVWEPKFDRTRQLEPGEIDLIIVPGLAFTAAGCRLGRGGGYYDRLLAMAPSVKKIGLAYAAQLLDEVPAADHDKPVDAVITP